MSMTIVEFVLEVGRQMDANNIPDNGRTIDLTEKQYDDLKKELSNVFSVRLLEEYPNLKPRFNGFIINIKESNHG